MAWSWVGLAQAEGLPHPKDQTESSQSQSKKPLTHFDNRAMSLLFLK